jgi:hypothetical protein
MAEAKAALVKNRENMGSRYSSYCHNPGIYIYRSGGDQSRCILYQGAPIFALI